jgi:uncharacterized damage-inducible protein DinB
MKMATRAAEQETISTRLIYHWEQVCEKLLALAEEIPAAKFDYRPVNNLRTVADVLRHVAFWNNYVADSARGKKADDTANELSKTEFSTKPQIIGALKRSVAGATRALTESPSAHAPETVDMILSFIEHNCEHYGQLVVYARMNGIVPPASRR